MTWLEFSKKFYLKIDWTELVMGAMLLHVSGNPQVKHRNT